MSVVLHSIVAGTLLLAGAGKIRRPDEFARIVLGYRLLPWSASRWVARVLPPAEIALAAGVATGLLAPVAELTSAALFACFATALAINLARGRRDLDCGCFGSASTGHGITWWHPARAVLLVGTAVGAAVVGPPSAGEVALTVVVVAVMAMAAAARVTMRSMAPSKG